MPTNPTSGPGTIGVNWYTGSGAPSASLGTDGDLYLDTVTGNVYQNTAGTWAVISVVAGGGATWYSGRGAPASTLGNNGDYYLQTSNGSIWTKIAGTWTKVQTVSTATGGDAWTTVTKSADQSISNNATLTNDSELQFVAANGAIYRLEVVLIYGSPAGAGSPDFKFTVAEDATVRGELNCQGWNTTDTTVNAAGVALNNASSLGLGTAATDRVVTGQGNYIGAGGTAHLMWAQNSINASATILRAKSYLRYLRVN